MSIHRPGPADEADRVAPDGLRAIGTVRRSLRHDLSRELTKHRYIADAKELNEKTYCSIASEVRRSRLPAGYIVLEDDAIPGTSYRADIVIHKNRATGVIAIEGKPDVRPVGLFSDLEELERYIRGDQVNFGVLLYFSWSDRADAPVRSKITRSR